MSKKGSPVKKGAPVKKGLYDTVITGVFERYYSEELNRFEFKREDLVASMNKLGIELSGDEKTLAKNIGDIIYTYRFRKDFPRTIRETAPKGKMWIITGKGDARYEFRLRRPLPTFPSSKRFAPPGMMMPY